MNECKHENTTIVEVPDVGDPEVCDDCGKMLDDDWPSL